MKKTKSSTVDNLAIDVLEYAFVEWLVRRNVYRAFQANYDRSISNAKTFRGILRDHIRSLYNHPVHGPEILIASAFVFMSTPEGSEFWQKVSDDWKRFYDSL